MKIDKVIVYRYAYDEIIKAGNKSPEQEVCGIGIGFFRGIEAVIQSSIQITNVSPEDIQIVDYDMNPQELYDALSKTSTVNKLSPIDFTMIWHTHPTGEPVPSSIDLARAGTYNVVYLIYASSKQTILAWGFDNNKKQFYPIEMEIEEIGVNPTWIHQK